MMDFVSDINEHTAWLYTKLYQNDLFFFDLWSLVHLWSGFMVYLLARALQFKRPMLVLVISLVAYEVVEILFIYIALNVFRPETIKDQFTDIFIGIAGGLACVLFLEAVSRFHDRYPGWIKAFIIFVVSSSYAFIWVGTYRYHYNVESYNTQGINVSSMTGWTLGGIYIISIYLLLRKKSLPLRLGLTWLCFLLVLLPFEYIYYYTLEVRETSGLPLKPLVFGLIHGTRTLHFFYLAAPFILIAVYEFGRWLVSRASATSLLSDR